MQFAKFMKMLYTKMYGQKPKYAERRSPMESYNYENATKRIVAKVEMGIIPRFMIKEVIYMDSSIPDFAKERVTKEALEVLQKK